ncbi:MAG: hypothetical protein ACJ746_00320 [Bryobacteraceae bacterium]
MSVMANPNLKQTHYGLDDRIDGYSLDSVHEIAWPIYDHTLSIAVPTSIRMNVFEHALLSLLVAGIATKDELQAFLGIGPRYFEQLIRELSGSDRRIIPLITDNGDVIAPNANTAAALTTNAKSQLETRESSAFRDAMFGMPLPGLPVDLVDPVESFGSRNVRPLSPLQDPWQDPASAGVGLFLDLIPGSDISRARISETGVLRWTRLLLASYTADIPRSGRILLFNPVDDNRPLHDLSASLETSILSDVVPQSYCADLIDSFALWCIDFKEQLQRTAYSVDIARHQQLLDKTEQEESNVKVAADNPSQFRALQQQKYHLEAELNSLREQLAQAPTIIHIGTREHQTWFAKALDNAQETILIISPWIKMRVLRKWLPSIERALGRQCEIWIGHGMPKSSQHSDASDQSALDVLDELSTSSGCLYRIPDLGTHEKILICDDEFIVSSSYNWLSFSDDAGYDRYEHGIVHAGLDVARLKEQLLRRLRKRKKRSEQANGYRGSGN